jgi:glycerol-3-phosphate O-acyltransferase
MHRREGLAYIVGDGAYFDEMRERQVEAAVADDESDFLPRCLKTGKQQPLQGRVFSAESISKSLYQTGLQLARYRGLLPANKAAERRGFHQEFHRITDRLNEILAITLAEAEGR